MRHSGTPSRPARALARRLGARAVRPVSLALAPLLAPACGPAPPEPPSAGQMAFGVFGDGPYSPFDGGPYRRVLADVAAADVAWLIHVGDIAGSDCSDALYADRFRGLDTLPFPVVYTPGDNEWTDCHVDADSGGRSYDPLERLDALRRVFFRDPGHSLGRTRLALESQADDPAFAGFVENARWARGGVQLATLHVVGSGNGLEPFPGRDERHDRAVRERTRAALAWLDGTFAKARRDSANAVVLALHGAVWDEDGSARPEYAGFVRHLTQVVSAFPGPVLLVHGDDHVRLVDHPLRGPDGATLPGFTRVETFGSPDMGWVRVVVDTVAGRFVRFEPRRMPGWW